MDCDMIKKSLLPKLEHDVRPDEGYI
jgi:hypothetical protein